MAELAPPRVFISYSHDTPAHQDRVLDFANRLRAHGIDASIDQYVPFPGEGWPNWCEAEIRKAQFVLLVCTETYLRRVNREEEPGKGHGVLWEAQIIKQEVYDAGSVNKKFVPVLFADGSHEHVPTPIRGASIYRIEADEGYWGLYRLLTDQPEVRKPELGTLRRLPERQRKSLIEPGTIDRSAEPENAAPDKPPMSASSLPHPRVEDLFVGRRTERERLAAAVFPATGTRRAVVVSGMAGVGKSYLVDRFYWENMARFPGGYVRLALDPDNPASAADLLATLRDRLKLPAGNDAELAFRLSIPLSLVHIENADNFDAGRVVGDVAAVLPECALVVSARFRDLGFSAGWGQVPLDPFDEAIALQQLQAELGVAAPGQPSWPALAAALGYLPLALHLAAGHLRAGRSAEAFLQRLRANKLALEGADPADPTFRERSRALLSDTFELSLAALRREGGAQGDDWLAGFAALGHAPATGFGESLGAAISGVAPDMFEDMAIAGARLSLLDRVPRGVGSAFRLHPLLAELLRPRAEKDAVIGRITEWFVTRLPLGGDDQGHRWNEISEEIAALTEWLGQISLADRVQVERAGRSYAKLNGPFYAWLRFCEEALADEIADEDRSNFLWTLGQVARRGGLPDRALAAAQEKRDLDLKRGAERDAALAAGLMADILTDRGQLKDALKIRQEGELPVYQRLGDVRSHAITMGQIADILLARGQLDDALKIRQEEVLPVFDRLGDVRSRAITMGKIADILMARGQLDEALKILQEVQPDFERLGDVRTRAVTMGKVADILLARGQLDDALKIRQEEVLPVFDRLGDVRSRAVAMGKIADILQTRGQLDEALKIRQKEVLPVFERLGDVRELLIGRAKLAVNLLLRAREGDREEARRLLHLALEDARRVKLPEAAQIEQVIKQAGLKD